jgi:nicotinamide mononucleotide transporter
MDIPLIEIAAVILGLLSVYFTVKQNIWCWPTGLAMVVLYVYIFYNAKLYSDMGENLIYIVLQLHGWWFWVYGRKRLKNQKTVPITRLQVRQWLICTGVIIAGTAVLGYSMATYTDADLPYLDAFTTVMSLTAQWLLNKKILETWVLWIIVDVFALGIYWYKDLHLTTGLYAVFLGLAIMGLIEWYNSPNHAKA